MTDATVALWGRDIGAVTWDGDREHAVFQYDPAFARSGIEISPLMMPLRRETYSFPALPKDTFKGLPGLLADALPDKFGNRLIDAWLAEQNRKASDFNPVERLCYVGRRGMGALEFKPQIGTRSGSSRKVDVAGLVRLANLVLDERNELAGRLSGGDGDRNAIEDILRVGTSAGGARAKAVLAWNPQTGEFRSGQVDAEAGFQHWLVKFDGVANNRDKEVADPQGYGLIEYAYHLMATEAGITMAECRLHHEGGRSHFMTRRFDRGPKGKVHMQSLCALQHYDFNDPTGYSYEQAMLTIQELGLGMTAAMEQLRRAVFNVVARNQDDHVKNIAFLMDRTGTWSLSPAFDVIYAWQPDGQWTSRHQMSINGKRDGFDRADLVALAQTAGIKAHRAAEIMDDVLSAVRNWRDHASAAGVGEKVADQIARAHRTGL